MQETAKGPTVGLALLICGRTALRSQGRACPTWLLHSNSRNDRRLSHVGCAAYGPHRYPGIAVALTPFSLASSVPPQIPPSCDYTGSLPAQPGDDTEDLGQAPTYRKRSCTSALRWHLGGAQIHVSLRLAALGLQLRLSGVTAPSTLRAFSDGEALMSEAGMTLRLTTTGSHASAGRRGLRETARIG